MRLPTSAQPGPAPALRLAAGSSSPPSPPADPIDRLEPAREQQVSFEEAVRVLFPKDKPRDPLSPHLKWEIEGAQSLPWVGPRGQLFLGVHKNHATPFEGTVQYRIQPQRESWTTDVKGKLKEQPVGFKDQVLAALEDPFHLVSLEPASGEVRWDSKNVLDPLVVNEQENHLFARTYQQEVTRLDPATGSRMWVSKTEGVPLKMQDTGHGVLAGSVVSHQSGEGRVGLLDHQNGEILWQRSVYAAEFATDDRHVFVAAAETFPSEIGGEILQLDLTTGTPVKTMKTEARKVKPLHSDGTRLFVSLLGHNSKSRLAALDLAQGKEAWSHDFGYDGVSKVVAGPEGQLYVVGGRSVYCFDETTGHPIWKGDAGNSPELTVTPDGTVITRSSFGVLRAYQTPDLREKALEQDETFEFSFDENAINIGGISVERG